jgi:hypothetical protein
MTSIDLQTRSFIEGLADFDVVFLKLARNSKHTLRGWEHYIQLHEQRGASRIDLALPWLDQGFGLGFLPRNRLWAIDLDRPKWASEPPMLERLMDFQSETLRFGPRVLTPSGGLHAYMRLPEGMDLDRLKHHVCHPEEDDVRLEWDFKMGARTLLVAPGTTREGANGLIRRYAPETLWFPPPVCDPRWMMPDLEILKPEPEPFLTDPREERDRIARAVAFLRTKAPVSVLHSGGAGHRALWKVAVHLVAYLRLAPLLAVHLMTHPEAESWNVRCRDTSGKPAPWSKGELQAACYAAVGEVPPYGVWEFRQQQGKNRIVKMLAEFIHAISLIPTSSEQMLASDLYRLFLSINGIEQEECSQKTFGAAINDAIQEGSIGISRKRSTHARLWTYVGVSEAQVLKAIHEQEQVYAWLDEAA